MAGPNETPMNVRLIEKIRLVYDNVKSIHDQIKHVDEGYLQGNITYSVDQSPPPIDLGETGDSAIYEDDDSWQVWYRVNGLWRLIGKKGGILVYSDGLLVSSETSVEIEHEIVAE